MKRNQSPTQHIDEGTLHAWLDGALSPDEASRVEQHLASCERCAAAAAEARGLVAAASRILTALDEVPGGVAPGGRRAGAGERALPERRRRPVVFRWPVQAAAAILFAAGASLIVIQRLDQKPREQPVEREAAQEAKAVVPAAPAPVPAAAAQQKKQAPRSPARDSVQRAPAAASNAVSSSVASAEPPSASRSAQALQGVTGAAQDVKISGRVVDEAGKPVSSALVQLSNPKVTTETNDSGSYALSVPAAQAAGQQSAIAARRIGYAAKTDSVTVMRDDARHDFHLAPSTAALSQVVVTGVAKEQQQAAAGCYTISADGLPARIELGDSVRITSQDSAAFPSSSWSPSGRDSVRIVFEDSTGAEHKVAARVYRNGLRGRVMSDSGLTVKPFAAKRCPK